MGVGSVDEQNPIVHPSIAATRGQLAPEAQSIITTSAGVCPRLTAWINLHGRGFAGLHLPSVNRTLPAHPARSLSHNPIPFPISRPPGTP